MLQGVAQVSHKRRVHGTMRLLYFVLYILGYLLSAVGYVPSAVGHVLPAACLADVFKGAWDGRSAACTNRIIGTHAHPGGQFT